jgi:hypothetical protein
MIQLTSRIGLVAIALMATLPFLLPEHTTPIPTFYSEWVAAALGLAASFSLLGARALPLPGAALLSLSLAGVSLVQFALGRAPVPQLAELFAMYLLWAALLACTGRHLASVFGLARLSRVLAKALVAGACLAALLSLLQPWLLTIGWTGYSPSRGGPLGQGNHLVSYIWLGLASALYLRGVDVFSMRVFWVVVALLTLTLVLNGQRSSFMYALALTGIAAWQTRTGGDRAPLRLAVKTGLLFLLLQPMALLIPPINAEGAIPVPSMRAVALASGPSVRVQLARVGSFGVVDSPLLGNGVGSFPGLALAHADDIAAQDNPGPAEHAHNLLIDLSTEIGVPAVLLVLLGAGSWVWPLLRRSAPGESVWAISVFAILGLHSMIEYPLWHSYFLGLMAVVAGAFGNTREVGRRLAPLALTLGLVAWGSLHLIELRRDYRQIELSLALGAKAAQLPQAAAALLRVPKDSLLTPWVQTIACVSLDPLQVSVVDGLAVCRPVMAFAPGIESGVHMAVLLWRTGDIAAADGLMHQLRSSSGYDPEGVSLRLAPLVSREPRLEALTKSRI